MVGVLEAPLPAPFCLCPSGWPRASADKEKKATQGGLGQSFKGRTIPGTCYLPGYGTSLSHAMPPGLSWEPHAVPLPPEPGSSGS